MLLKLNDNDFYSLIMRLNINYKLEYIEVTVSFTNKINGYEMTTTFWQDFSIADKFGVAAIKDTYKRAFNEWKSNYKYLTELVMVLNWKIWQHYENNESIARVYNELWEEADLYAQENLHGEEAEYFFRTTD